MSLKVVYSSTQEQEQEIGNLSSEFYDSIFPSFFSTSEILHYREIGVLTRGSSNHPYIGTLKSAYQVISALNVIKFILEPIIQDEPDRDDEKNIVLLEKNIKILTEAGIFFPFTAEHFESVNYHFIRSELLTNSEPDNKLLI